MGKRGKKPTPRAFKVLKGTFREGDHKGEPDPPVVRGVPAVPAWLGSEGSRRWRETAAWLVGMGVLADADLHALELYCAAWDELAACERAIKRHGAYFTANSGYVGQHPAVNRSFKARDVIRRYQQEFGMTPSARSGVKMAGDAASATTASKIPVRKRG